MDPLRAEHPGDHHRHPQREPGVEQAGGVGDVLAHGGVPLVRRRPDRDAPQLVVGPDLSARVDVTEAHPEEALQHARPQILRPARPGCHRVLVEGASQHPSELGQLGRLGPSRGDRDGLSHSAGRNPRRRRTRPRTPGSRRPRRSRRRARFRRSRTSADIPLALVAHAPQPRRGLAGGRRSPGEVVVSVVQQGEQVRQGEDRRREHDDHREAARSC